MDVFNKPVNPDKDIVKNLGPLAPLVGVWEGDQGVDIAPARKGPAETRYRERLTFDPLGPVVNGPQVLYGLRYATTVWPMGQDEAFHEETGYWLWDARDQQVMRCFMVPRGVTVLAGGAADPHARVLKLSALVGSETYGILSNPFLDKAFKTVRYELTVTLNDDGSFSYAEDTQLKIPGQADIFHHTDKNTLRRAN
ncbi:MAG: hypothetical protein FD165_2296 [Gammaproteobacteria bacterium]|nr:MAG: hypothetical protein FD165_2296 [Gammaproteobacteria bacterium]TND02628.1 MAG: hypothetical protein FD120_2089 [Gammaproteobacteria bacterium]